MEQVQLKDFIRDTLIEIAEGIRAANGQLEDPEKQQFGVFMLRHNLGDQSKIPGIQFDIAVTVAKNQHDKAGFMVALVNIGGGATTEKKLSDEVVHRIRFEVGIEDTWR